MGDDDDDGDSTAVRDDNDDGRGDDGSELKRIDSGEGSDDRLIGCGMGLAFTSPAKTRQKKDSARLKRMVRELMNGRYFETRIALWVDWFGVSDELQLA